MPKFLPGLEISKAFYSEVVRPILDEHFFGVAHSAALIGSGSEVLGYDTDQSTDHHWGPRILLFLSEEDHVARGAIISATLAAKLPYTFRGYSTNFGEPDEIGVRLMRETGVGPVHHRVEIFTVRSFFMSYLGSDPGSDIGVSDWLTFPEHRLLGVTAGRVFHDGLGDLTRARKKFSYYPHDVWLYLLASEWEKISQVEAFVGRCGDVGDDLGSRLVAASIVSRLMRLCFLMERSYPPYSKWFGTAFSRLACAPVLAPVLAMVMAADTWEERETHLSQAYRVVAEKHNALGITAQMETETSKYHERPYMVIHADSFAAAIKRSIKSEDVRAVEVTIGSVNQFVASSDDLEKIEVRRKLEALYK